MVEQQPSKLNMRVRFPLPAPKSPHSITHKPQRFRAILEIIGSEPCVPAPAGLLAVIFAVRLGLGQTAWCVARTIAIPTAF